MSKCVCMSVCAHVCMSGYIWMSVPVSVNIQVLCEHVCISVDISAYA